MSGQKDNQGLSPPTPPLPPQPRRPQQSPAVSIHHLTFCLLSVCQLNNHKIIFWCKRPQHNLLYKIALAPTD